MNVVSMVERADVSHKALYRHPPIGSDRHIRLLRVLSMHENDHDTICEFRVVSIDDPPVSYRAISYCWGNSDLSEKAWFADNQYIPITISAANILRHLAAENMKEYIWIDGLCINQGDVSEKNSQVPLMADVYSKCSEVLGWLGSSDPSIESGLQLVALLEETIQRLKDASTPITKQSIADSPGCDHPSDAWRGLVRMLDQDFFQRIWIVQEMVLSPKVVLMCGGATASWRSLSAISTIHEQGLGHMLLALEDGHFAKGKLGVLEINNLRDHANAGRKSTLQQCLLSCYAFSATDPRDRIFALRNICENTNHQALLPDYGANTAEVFTRAAVHFLVHNMDLTVLSAAGIGMPRETADLPSWVADWSVVSDSKIFGSLAKTAGYTTCGDNQATACVSFDKMQRSLTIRGRFLDSVRALIDSAPKEDWTLDASKRANKYAANFAWLEYLSKLCTAYPTGEPFFPDVLARTLIANVTTDGLEAPVSFIAKFMDFWNLNRLLAESQPNSEGMYSNLPPEETVNSALQYFETMRNTFALHTIFLTDNSYIGLGPGAVSGKDRLCLFNEASVPFLLRLREDGKHELVGECYVHGLMKGEGLNIGVEEEITIF